MFWEILSTWVLEAPKEQEGHPTLSIAEISEQNMELLGQEHPSPKPQRRLGECWVMMEGFLGRWGWRQVPSGEAGVKSACASVQAEGTMGMTI